MLRGKTIGVPTFEPIPEQAFNDDELKAYREAYENLPSDAAAATITALASKHQDDPLLKLHAKRIEDGKSGAEIMIA